MNKKWTLWAGLILILVVFILIWQFAPAIQRWLANVFIDIIVLALTFAAGWLLGRYGGRRNRNRDQENARNITEAQKRWRSACAYRPARTTPSCSTRS